MNHPEPCFGRESCGCRAVRASVRLNTALVAMIDGSVVKVQLWYKHYRPGLRFLLPTVDILQVVPVENRLREMVSPFRREHLSKVTHRSMGIPTLIYFQNGREADRVIGATRYPDLKAKLEELTQA